MSSPLANISTRLVRLKVLYTFDAESKNNCLARWPQVLDVQTAFLDDSTQIGLVDLRTCLQALSSSSPELFSQEATDYTVYAYDYSEEGTPLSGQGMLSSVFGPESEGASDDASSKVVTGRVTKNFLGLFSGNGSEMLEVKLRLLPVAKPGLSHRMHSPAISQTWGTNNSQSFDTPAWLNPQNRPQSVSSGSPVDTTGLENMQRMLHEGNTPRESSAVQPPEPARPLSSSRPGSRTGTPGPTQSFHAPSRQSFSQASRSASRAVGTGATQSGLQRRRESFNSGYYSGEENQLEEGQPKKRAKITQVGAPSRSDLNIERQPESLRMVASTASSVRVHRPNAINPALSNLQFGSALEEPVRPPTPIPRGRKPAPRRLNSEPSGLFRQSLQQDAPIAAQAGMQSFSCGNDLSATSPDFSRAPSVSSTPANIPSSPPVAMNRCSMPSSPVLPPPRSEHGVQDSGFMSGFDDMAMINLGIESGECAPNLDVESLKLQPSVESNVHAVESNQQPATFQMGTHGDGDTLQIIFHPQPEISGQTTTLSQQPPRPQTARPAVRAGMSSPRLAPAPYPRARQLEEELAAQPTLPPVLASDPAGRQFHRSNTWAGDTSDLPTSDAPTGEVGRPKLVSKKKVGREQTKARLENALAQNEMPPYCDNCGTIDTPAWRRVFAKTLPGHLFDSVQVYPETPGAFVWKQVVAQDHDGSIKTFRAYKLSKGAEDKGEEWSCVTLCNPCGLWFHKNKCMRPQEKWGRNPKDPNHKKKRAYRPKSRRVAAKKEHEGDGRSDAPDAGSDSSSPADGATEGEPDVSDNIQEQNSADAQPGQPSGPAQAAVSEPTTGGSSRGEQSSQVDSAAGIAQPEHTNLTPKPTRRKLFSSPSDGATPTSQFSSPRSNDVQPLTELPNVCRRSPRFTKSSHMVNARHQTPEENKENPMSGFGVHDDLFELFHDEDDGFQMGPPQTPTPARRSGRLLAQTPTKTPSSSMKRSPGMHLSPCANKGAANARTTRKDFGLGANRTTDRLGSSACLMQEQFRQPLGYDMTDDSVGPALTPRTPKSDCVAMSNRTVEEMTPFTRVIHEALSRHHDVQEHDEDGNARETFVPPSPYSDAGGVGPSPAKTLSPMSRHVAALDSLEFPLLDDDEFANALSHEPSGVVDLSTAGIYGFLNSDYMEAGLDGPPCWPDGETNPAGNDDHHDFLALPLPVPVPMMEMAGSTVLRRSPRKNKSR